MNLQILGIQLDCVWEDKEANFAKVRALLNARDLPEGGLIVLPEMFATGFSCEVTRTIEPEDGPTEAFCANWRRLINAASSVVWLRQGVTAWASIRRWR